MCTRHTTSIHTTASNVDAVRSEQGRRRQEHTTHLEDVRMQHPRFLLDAQRWEVRSGRMCTEGSNASRRRKTTTGGTDSLNLQYVLRTLRPFPSSTTALPNETAAPSTPMTAWTTPTSNERVSQRRKQQKDEMYPSDSTTNPVPTAERVCRTRRTKTPSRPSALQRAGISRCPPDSKLPTSLPALQNAT
ncbi:hypothetical protein Hypma_012601 [Hypsizygus marmoreus]|uniref:Uncharacterized protein n=1 Tax=Hypsizygus marmoreus TaxID=39966 RepID=A0A369JDN7_HYPMA|nr:hypothetical protein Hypma_012601 [Hypsizygus marmoreus]